MRRLAVAILASLALGTALPASAQQLNGNEKAYTLSLICSNVAAFYRDTAGMVKSRDVAQRMGRVLGYPESRVASELWQMASVLGVENKNDPSKMPAHLAQCRSYGLAS